MSDPPLTIINAGDLTHPRMVGIEQAELVYTSWRLLRDRGATRVYPAHGPIWPLKAVDLSG